jgi:hypothetical protein
MLGQVPSCSICKAQWMYYHGDRSIRFCPNCDRRRCYLKEKPILEVAAKSCPHCGNGFDLCKPPDKADSQP